MSGTPRKAFIDRREPGTFLQELGDGRLITISHQPLANGGWVATYEDVTERRRGGNAGDVHGPA